MYGPFRLQQLCDPLSARLSGADCEVLGVSTDTRSIKQGDLFIALRGDNFDAHDFIDTAVGNGAVAVVVEHEVDADIPQLIVSNTRMALGNIAAYNRSFFKGALFAVTGSGGKTTVKEMMASINRLRGRTLATLGNLNNDIGVPLTLLRLSAADQYAVIEMGASGPHEIAYSTHLAKPDVAILNNALGAHLEGFGSLQGVVKAKAEIFDGLSPEGTAIVNLDDPHAPVWLGMLQQQPLMTFSVSDTSATVFASEAALQSNGCYQFRLNYSGKSCLVSLGLMGKHNIANAVAAAAALLADGCEMSVVAEGLSACRGVSGRMRPYQIDSQTLVIDDSYNANPDAVMAAADSLLELNGESVLVLGDLAELGHDAEQQHRDLGTHLAGKGLGALYSCGQLSKATVEGFLVAGGNRGKNFTTQEELIGYLKELPEAKRNLLIKGSRSAGMERVVEILTNGERH